MTAETCASVLERIAGQAERAGEMIRHIRRFVRNEEPQTRAGAGADAVCQRRPTADARRLRAPLLSHGSNASDGLRRAAIARNGRSDPSTGLSG